MDVSFSEQSLINSSQKTGANRDSATPELSYDDYSNAHCGNLLETSLLDAVDAPRSTGHLNGLGSRRSALLRSWDLGNWQSLLSAADNVPGAEKVVEALENIDFVNGNAIVDNENCFVGGNTSSAVAIEQRESFGLENHKRTLTLQGSNGLSNMDTFDYPNALRWRSPSPRETMDEEFCRLNSAAHHIIHDFSHKALDGHYRAQPLERGSDIQQPPTQDSYVTCPLTTTSILDTAINLLLPPVPQSGARPSRTDRMQLLRAWEESVMPDFSLGAVHDDADDSDEYYDAALWEISTKTNADKDKPSPILAQRPDENVKRRVLVARRHSDAAAFAGRARNTLNGADDRLSRRIAVQTHTILSPTNGYGGQKNQQTNILTHSRGISNGAINTACRSNGASVLPSRKKEFAAELMEKTNPCDRVGKNPLQSNAIAPIISGSSSIYDGSASLHHRRLHKATVPQPNHTEYVGSLHGCEKNASRGYDGRRLLAPVDKTDLNRTVTKSKTVLQFGGNQTGAQQATRVDAPLYRDNFLHHQRKSFPVRKSVSFMRR